MFSEISSSKELKKQYTKQVQNFLCYSITLLLLGAILLELFTVMLFNHTITRSLQRDNSGQELYFLMKQKSGFPFFRELSFLERARALACAQVSINILSVQLHHKNRNFGKFPHDLKAQSYKLKPFCSNLSPSLRLFCKVNTQAEFQRIIFPEDKEISVKQELRSWFEANARFPSTAVHQISEQITHHTE